MKMTPCPTNTSSWDRDPVADEGVALDLAPRPTTAPSWISTNGPIRVSSPIRHPYRFVNEWTKTSGPNSDSEISRYGASLAGADSTGGVLLSDSGSTEAYADGSCAS